MDDVRLARGPQLPLMVAGAELPGPANQSNVFRGTIGVDAADESLDPLVKSSPVGGGPTVDGLAGNGLFGDGPTAARLGGNGLASSGRLGDGLAGIAHR